MNTKHRSDSDEILETAIMTVRTTHLPETPSTRELLSRLPGQTYTDDSQSTITQPILRPFHVRPTVLKYGAALAFVVVAAFFLPSASTPSALAEVVANARNHRLVQCRLETLARVKMKLRADREAEYVDARSDEIVYFDLVNPRFRVDRRERTLNGTVDSQWIIVQDNQKNRMLITSSMRLAVEEKDTKDPDQLNGIAAFRESGGNKKVARIFRANDGKAKPFLHQNSKKTLLEILDHLQVQNDVDAVADEIDDRPADRFVFKNGNQTITMWADSESKLPVRIEEQQSNVIPDRKFTKWTYTDFEWDKKGADMNQLFSTKPPTGYVVEDHLAKP